MTSPHPPQIAIVGGGLCGISLGIALKRRNILFTLYESRSSFTEIGAGLNFGPTALKSLQVIKSSLRDKVYDLATRSPPPDENTWMWLRYGAPSGEHEDGEIIYKIQSPPTGSMTLHRQELLQSLAEDLGEGSARFNKKLESYTQDGDSVTLKFADGTEESASILVGCDGIHSRVRMAMFGKDSPTSKPGFDEKILYRAVLPMEKAVEAVGESARTANLQLGPDGYLISYPVNSGTTLNCGFWKYRKGETWDHNEWILPNHGEQFKRDAVGWGERVQKLLALFDQDPAQWAAFQHTHQPESFTQGRVILIGDGAHSMPPHQGAGAATALEDACVLAEIFSVLDDRSHDATAVEAAFQAFEKIRLPRSKTIHQYSSEGGARFFDFYKTDESEVEEWIRETTERLEWIWNIDMQAHADEAKAEFERLLSERSLVNGHS